MSSRLATEQQVKKTREFFEKYPIITFEEEEKILRSGEGSNYMYCLKSGYVRIYALAENGKEISINLLNPNMHKVITFAYTDLLHKYFIETVTRVELYKVPVEEYDTFLKSNPEMLLVVVDFMVEVVRQLTKQVEWLTMGNAYSRVATILFSLVNTHGESKNDIPQLSVRPTHQVIASLAGLSRETVTLQMNELEKKGVISYEGKRLVIHSLEKLKKETIITN